MKLRNILFFLYFRSVGCGLDTVLYLKSEFLQISQNSRSKRLSRCLLSKDPVFRVEILVQRVRIWRFSQFNHRLTF